MSSTPINYDNLNGLNVGDLIYNTNREAMFIITRFVFEHVQKWNEPSHHPYILGVPIVLGEGQVEIDTVEVPITIQGSRRINLEEADEMVLKHLQDANKRSLALQELAKLATA